MANQQAVAYRKSIVAAYAAMLRAQRAAALGRLLAAGRTTATVR